MARDYCRRKGRGLRLEQHRFWSSARAMRRTMDFGSGDKFFGFMIYAGR
jgi:hypothetical protein